jgi:multiple sugar transport system substrate-binding protein
VGVAAAACALPGGGTGDARAPAMPPATIEVVHDFGPDATVRGKSTAVMIDHVRQRAPHLTLKVTMPAGARAYETVLTMLAAGTPPDVSHTFVANAPTLGSKKIAAPLQGLLKGARDWSVRDYFEGVQEAFTYKGDFVLAPIFTGPTAAVVNLDLLQRANLAVPQATWTWDNVVSAAVQLTQRDGDEIKVYGLNLPTSNGYGAMNFFGAPLWAYGGDWADRTRGTVTFQQPEGIAALELWVDLALKRRVAPTSQPENFRGLSGGPFANGLVAIDFIASEGVGPLERNSPSFPWTAIQMPRNKKQGAHFYANGWFAVRDSRNQEAAAEFVRVASQAEALAAWNIDNFTMVTRKAAAARTEWQVHLKAHAALAVFNDALAYMRTYPPLPGWNDASIGNEGIGQALLDAVQGKIAPKTALEDAARRADNIIRPQFAG